MIANPATMKAAPVSEAHAVCHGSHAGTIETVRSKNVKWAMPKGIRPNPKKMRAILSPGSPVAKCGRGSLRASAKRVNSTQAAAIITAVAPHAHQRPDDVGFRTTKGTLKTNSQMR